MKTMNYIKALMVGALCSLFVSCQEDVYVATVVVEDPIISDFEPKSGPVGTEITIYGEHLEKIQSVTVGGGDTPILYRISENQLVVAVGTDTRTGVVAVTDNYGTEVSTSDSFTVSYATPAVEKWTLPTTSNLPVEGTYVAPEGNWGEVGQMIVFEGSNLHFVGEVQFCYQEEVDITDEEGNITGSEMVDAVAVGTFITQREDEIVVEIPLINVSSDTEIHLTYFDGTEDTYVDIASTEDMGIFHIIVLVPLITTDFPTSIVKYEPVTLEGYNLNLINSLYVEDEDGNVIKLRMTTQTSEYIIIDIATNFFSSDYNTDYTEGDVTPIWGFTGDVVMVYNIDKLETVASDVELWGNPVEERFSTYTGITMSGRSDKSYGEDMAFLDLDNGVVYSACAVYDVQANIDIMFYDTSGASQMYGAHGTTSTLKNYKCSGTSLTTLYSDWSALYANTTLFRGLDSSGDTEADAALIAAYEAIGTENASIVAFNTEYVETTMGLSTPSSKAPKVYTTASYATGQASLDHPYILVYSETNDKYGMMKVTDVVIESTSGLGQSLTFDLLWSL